MSNRNYIVLDRKGHEIKNINPVHPGYLIELEVEERGLKKHSVAVSLGIKPQNLSELIKGKRNVSAVLAVKLEQVFGVDASYWLRLQCAYDLANARKKLSI